MLKTLSTLFIVSAPLLAQQAAGAGFRASNAGWLSRVTPIHSQANDATFGAYGTWAAGAHYKVSFHSGFEFVPYLGKGYPKNLPLRLELDAARIGDRSLIEQQRVGSKESPTRYSYAHGGVTEIYDVRVGGIEQSFAIPRGPQAGGDLILSIRADTELTCEAVDSRAHRALTFRDDRGREILSYGAAVAVDAKGRRVPMDTTFNGQHIELSLPAKELRRLAFPIVVDPIIATFSGAPVAEVDGIDMASNNLNQLPYTARLFYVRYASATDADCFQIEIDSDLVKFRKLIFVDVTSSWSSLDTQMWRPASHGLFMTASAFVRLSPRSGTAQIRFFVNGVAPLYSIPSFSGARDRHPVMAETVKPLKANQAFTTGVLVVFSRSVGTGTTQLFATRFVHDPFGKPPVSLEAVAPQALTNVRSATIKHATLAETHLPIGSKTLGGINLISWQQMDSAKHFSIRVGGVFFPPKGKSGGAVAKVSSQLVSGVREYLLPKISGTPADITGQQRFAICYTTRARWPLPFEHGTDLRARTIHLHAANGKVSFGAERLIATSPNYYYSGHDLAFDDRTRAHWFVSARLASRTVTGKPLAFSAILGHTAASVRPFSVTPVRIHCVPTTISRSRYIKRFAVHERFDALCIYGGATANLTPTLEGYKFSHASAAGIALDYSAGPKCRGVTWPQLRAANNSRPFKGGSLWIGGGHYDKNAASALLISGVGAKVSLTGIGMTDCYLLVGPGVALPFVASATGGFNVPYLLPDTPLPFVGDLHMQVVTVKLGANATNLVMSNGLHAKVR